MGRSKQYPKEVRERAVRLVNEYLGDYDSEWEALVSIATKIGCATETLRKWVRKAAAEEGTQEGSLSAERARMKELERENRELRQTNEILRKASAFFAQAELDRRPN